MAGPGDAEDRRERHTATPEFIAGFYEPGPRHVREVTFAETVDAAALFSLENLFMPRFICRTCGPTNRIVGGPEGFVCVVCQQAAAYQIMTDAGILAV